MSKLSKFAESFPRYDIVSDLFKSGVEDAPFGVKTILCVLNENGSVSRKVTAEASAANVADAQSQSLELAVSRITGNAETKKLIEKYNSFDISMGASSSGVKELPVGVKAVITTYDDKGVAIRRVQSSAIGTSQFEVEKQALKGAVNLILGI